MANKDFDTIIMSDPQIARIMKAAREAAVARKAFTKAMIQECAGKDTTELTEMIQAARKAGNWERAELISIFLIDALHGWRCELIDETMRGYFYLDEVLEAA